MAKFFIDRPIFAWVIAIILMLAGVAAIFTLPIAQYPTIAPPSIQITANYPGASAKTVEDTVTQVIEQQMSGLDNFLYMSSTSDDAGNATITLTFAPGTNADIAQVQVQNKLSLATPILPQVVQQLGLSVTKSSSSFLLVLAFTSEDGSMNKYDLANYVASHVKDPISRINGVGTVTLFGSQYAMRIWLDPTRLTNYGLTPEDVTAAISAQNVQIAGGQIGGTPATPGTVLQATITESTLLQTPEQFGNVLLKVNQDGSQVRLKDVAKIGLGGENYNFDTKFNGRPSAAMGIQLATNANALATAKAVRAKIDELSKYYPHGLVVSYPYDTTPFVRLSIEEVVKTLLEGIVLVFLVMYLFLQNLRATIIPTIAVPVVLLGTFAVMSMVGFSINTLSMFGLVLAIGLLVDDAIVVVENVERVMAEEGLSPKEATRKAMGQITGALIGVALVLSAVFVPLAFSGSKYICICDCGETKAISAYNMLKGDSSSCGCLAKGRPRNRNTTDLSGKKIGKLSVVDMAPHVIGLGRMWNCVCDCGSNKVVRGHHLLSGIVTSCGCRTGKAAAACKSGDIATLTMSSGREVLIDSADLNLVTQYKWRVSSGYAKAHDRTNQAGVDAKGVFLHRLVMGCTVGDGRYVDHINGNRLDNRKSNLRICSQAENMRNTKIRSDNRSGFKGVRSHKGGNKWTASISVNKKRTYLGIFDTPEAAYAAYCKAAQELHGEFANLGEVA